MITKKRGLVLAALVAPLLLLAKAEVKSPALKKETAQYHKKQKTGAIVNKKASKKEPQKPKLKTVNKIMIIIYTDDQPIIITKLDLDRRSLDGRSRTEKEVLLERLLYHEAINVYRLPVPEDLVDKHIASIKEAHGIGEDQIAMLFEREGYTFEEGKEQLRMSYAIQHLIQQLIINRLVVTEKEIQEFHKAYPAREPASFRIKKGTIQKDEITQKELKELVEDGLYEERVTWSHPYWIDEDEIADSKRFIITMKPGQIRWIRAGDKYEIITLLKRKKARVKTLDERRREIADQIKMPKYEKLLKELHESVLNKYEIVKQS